MISILDHGDSLGADNIALYILSNLPKKVKQIFWDYDFFFLNI